MRIRILNISRRSNPFAISFYHRQRIASSGENSATRKMLAPRNAGFIFLLLLLICPVILQAQIVDDSTKLIYGPRTISFKYEEDYLNLNKNVRYIDTALTGFHRYPIHYQNNLLYQDLGNFGTPNAPVYYETPSTIGVRNGFDALNFFVFDPSRTRYYDTRSPFSQITYVQGSRGQQIIDAEFTRNITPRWNAGLDIRRISSRRIIGFPRQNDRQMINTAFSGFTSYTSKNTRYTLLANYTIFNQITSETGGLVNDSTNADQEALFDYDLQAVNFTSARSSDRRYYYHLYQQYSIDSTAHLQIYHQSDYQWRVNKYVDDDVSLHTNYYPEINYDSSVTMEINKNQLLDNRVGLKGRSGNFVYRAYYRNRYQEYKQRDTLTIHTYLENMFGAYFRYELNDSISGEISAEYKMDGGHVAQVVLRHPNVTFLLRNMEYSPTLPQLNYIGNHFNWSNDFANTKAGTAELQLHYQNKNIRVNPFARWDRIQNYIYYDSLSTPQQESSSVNIYSAGLRAELRWKSFRFYDHVRWSSVDGADVIRVPELFNHAALYMETGIFKRAAVIQFGIDVYYRSSYYANSYSPVFSQFILSDTQDPRNKLNDFLVSDVFVNMSLKQFTFFLRMSYANQGWPSFGYFTTPYYSALPRSIDFGINWKFYD